jgi:hypothetical protein
MPFTLKNLIEAKSTQQNQLTTPLIANFDLNEPCHGILDHSRNRLITLTRYKETVNLLINLKNLQPFFNINKSYMFGENFNDIISENSDLPYNLVIEAGNPTVRWVSEKRLYIHNIIKTNNDLTWKDPNSMSMKSVIELRLKAAALDYIYESLNYIRDKFNSEITLNEFVNNKRYQQATDYLEGKKIDFTLLEIYADEIEKDLNFAAMHCIFCYEENLLIISKTEKNRKIYERKILEAESYDELCVICKTWNVEFKGQI